MLTEVKGFLDFYRRGHTADVIQYDSGAGWGALFTLPPATSQTMERVGMQFRRIQARRIRYVRQAFLNCTNGKRMQVIIVTILPQLEQEVYNIETGERIRVKYLCDAALSTLEEYLRVQH